MHYTMINYITYYINYLFFNFKINCLTIKLEIKKNVVHDVIVKYILIVF